MNLTVVSHKHKYLIIAVDTLLHVYMFDYNKLKFSSVNKAITGDPAHVIDLNCDEINNLKLIQCDDREFVATVDFEGNVRMLFLDNLTRECIKFKNIYP